MRHTPKNARKIVNTNEHYSPNEGVKLMSSCIKYTDEVLDPDLFYYVPRSYCRSSFVLIMRLSGSACTNLCDDEPHLHCIFSLVLQLDVWDEPETKETCCRYFA